MPETHFVAYTQGHDLARMGLLQESAFHTGTATQLGRPRLVPERTRQRSVTWLASAPLDRYRALAEGLLRAREEWECLNGGESEPDEIEIDYSYMTRAAQAALDLLPVSLAPAEMEALRAQPTGFSYDLGIDYEDEG